MHMVFVMHFHVYIVWITGVLRLIFTNLEILLAISYGERITGDGLTMVDFFAGVHKFNQEEFFLLSLFVW